MSQFQRYFVCIRSSQSKLLKLLVKQTDQVARYCKFLCIIFGTSYCLKKGQVVSRVITTLGDRAEGCGFETRTSPKVDSLLIRQVAVATEQQSNLRSKQTYCIRKLAPYHVICTSFTLLKALAVKLLITQYVNTTSSECLEN